MKITGSRSYIIVEFDHRSVRITGELTTTPAFYAEINSIKNWEPPYENTPITDFEKKQIIAGVMEETEKGGMKIIFE